MKKIYVLLGMQVSMKGVTLMNEAVQTELNEAPNWAWIRFIPVKLHIAGLWGGAGLGYLIDKQLSTEWVFSWGIGLLMALVGSYWQVQKDLIRKSFRENRSRLVQRMRESREDKMTVGLLTADNREKN